MIDVYEQLGETEPLAELLEKRLPYASQDERVELQMRLAKLNADQRGQPRKALDHVMAIIEAQPQRRDALDFALSLAEQLADFERVHELLDRILTLPLATHERANWLERRGRLLADELGRPEQAVASYREALALDRGRASARAALRAQLEGLERWPALLDLLYVEASEAEGTKRIELLEAAAELAWTRVSPDASLPWLARLRRERPDDPALLARLAEVHRRAGRFEAALRALDEQLDRVAGPVEQVTLHLERAKLLERDLHAPVAR